ncbi:MAG: branched-chain-amino-acid transaminase [Bacteroidetes bacterium]|nr:branched-chain-amino-acid transaminase [Bacteroidota bacterium]
MNPQFKDSVLFLDGQFVKAKDAHTNVYNQTLHYGFGVFEGLRSFHTVNGTKIFKPYEHFERMIKSCRLMNIPFDYSVEELVQLSYQVLEKNNLSNAYIRPLVMAGENMTLSAPQQSSVMICAWPWKKYFDNKLLSVCISTHQHLSPKSMIIEAKVCGHFVNSILASTEARQHGFDEALMLDANGFVTEGPAANFFFEKDGVLYTAPVGNILPGITRQTVLDICHTLDLPVKEKYFLPEELHQADSAFFCGTAVGITGIHSVEGHTLNKPWITSMGAVVQEAYRNMVLEKSYAYCIV